MDTSEAYIKMCDCEEVQGAYKFDAIDFHGWPCFKSTDFIGHYVREKDNYYMTIWLPRQDQIQEMLDFTPATHWAIDFVVEIYGYIEDGHRSYLSGCMKEYYQQFQSWEQLWLVFYMHEKHGKTWDGEKWV